MASRNAVLLGLPLLLLQGCASASGTLVTRTVPVAAVTPSRQQAKPLATMTLTATGLPTTTSTPTLTPSATADIQRLRAQGISDPWIVATLEARVRGTSVRVLFDPTTRYLAVSRFSTVTLWEVGTYRQLHVFNLSSGKDHVEEIGFSHDGNVFAAVASPPERSAAYLLVWDATAGSEIVLESLHAATLDVASGYPYSIVTTALAFSPTVSMIAVADGNAVLLIDPSEPGTRSSLDLGKDMYASQIAFSADGRFIYVLMQWWQDHGWPIEWKTKSILQIWDASSHLLRRTIVFPRTDWAAEIMQLNGSFLMRRYPDEATADILDLRTDEVTPFVYRPGWPYWTHDRSLITFMGYWAAFDDKNAAIEFWSADAWRLLYKLQPYFYQYPDPASQFGSWPGELDISIDNQLMAIGYAAQAFVYDIRIITAP